MAVATAVGDLPAGGGFVVYCDTPLPVERQGAIARVSIATGRRTWATACASRHHGARRRRRREVCPRCQHENADDTDFCAQCGEYLRWGPTVTASGRLRGRLRAGSRPRLRLTSRGWDPPPAPPPASASVAGTPRSTCGWPADAAAVGDVTATVEPGKTVAVLALVHNQSGIVDNYDVRVEGLPEGW